MSTSFLRVWSDYKAILQQRQLVVRMKFLLNKRVRTIFQKVEKHCPSALTWSRLPIKDLLINSTASPFLRLTASISIYATPVPSPRGALKGLTPPKQSSKTPDWSMKHYKSAEFLLIVRMSSPPAEMRSPPIENVLATLLCNSESLQICESRAQSADSSKPYSKHRSAYKKASH